MTQKGRRVRLVAVGSVCVIATMTLWLRLVQVQVLRHDAYSAISQRQIEDPREVKPTRGGIFDREGRPLALSSQMYSVSVSPQKIRNRAAVERVLARTLDLSGEYVRSRVRSSGKFVWLTRQVALSEEERTSLSALGGIEVHREPGRIYPFNGVAAKIVGFVGHDNLGCAGIEVALHEELSGKSGEAIFIRNGTYRSDRYYKVTKKKPLDGRHVYLTIDVVIQEIAEAELEQAVAKHKAKSGAVIVMDVRTGEILALAESPCVSDRGGGSHTDSLWTIRSISHVYEPGSTFKLVTAAALLETDAVSPTDTFDAEGGVANLGFATIRDTHPHGVITFREAFSLSSNIVMAKAARALDAEDFYRYIRLFGFGARSGVQLAGESAGRVPGVDSWSLRTKSTLAFGQEIAVTPLQMLTAMAAVANDGKMMMPRIVLGVGDESTGEVKRSKAVMVRRVVTPRTARMLREFSRDVVTDGTGTMAALDFMPVSGKTGTAQKASARGGYKANKYVASFVGFAPHDEPRIAILVMLDEPRWASRYGGDSAAPVFARVCRGIANATNVFDGVITGELVTPTVSLERSHITPNFLRMERSAALQDARRRGVNVLCQGEEGRVCAQSPDPGVPMDPDGLIRLQVSSAVGEGKTRVVPNMKGMSMRRAKLEATRAGFVPRFVGRGVVQRQEPAAGQRDFGAPIKLYCATGGNGGAGSSK